MWNLINPFKGQLYRDREQKRDLPDPEARGKMTCMLKRYKVPDEQV
jgi:hypothetical protein